MFKRLMTLLLIVGMLLPVGAGAEEAQNMIEECELTVNGKKTYGQYVLWDGDFATDYRLAANRYMDVDAGEKRITGVFVQFLKESQPLTVQIEQDGEYVTVGEISGKYLSEYVQINADVTRVRIINNTKKFAHFCELSVFGEGEKPVCAANWVELEKADMMLVVAHPDDDLLWFGGLLPYYAGEKGLRVQVVYLAPTSTSRRTELLAALWECGVTAYPTFLGFHDKQAKDLNGQYKMWRKSRVFSQVTGVIRQYKPQVLITQDFNGEYGHAAHRLVADACKECIVLAADPQSQAKSAKQYGAWQVKKFYVHLYDQNQIRMDWQQPLAHFGGRTAIEVTTDAFRYHASQVRRGWGMDRTEGYDNDLFGLYYTAVGPDIIKNDLMENIQQ